jgi:hypothetical protein
LTDKPHSEIPETDHDGDLNQFLPLRPADLHILVALSSEDRHGYGIIQEVARPATRGRQIVVQNSEHCTVTPDVVITAIRDGVTEVRSEGASH